MENFENFISVRSFPMGKDRSFRLGKSPARRGWRGEEESTDGGGNSSSKRHKLNRAQGCVLGTLSNPLWWEHRTHIVLNKTEKEARA